ncbi:hypothetical protein H4582DRAFT_884011 [Lactarius indigo]|nr:hypothetical protein H4582DRAFT_884011 [Lactarius indigo]
MNCFLSVGDTFTPLLHTLRIPTYTHLNPASGVMQRSQSTPNVGVRPTVVQLHQAPRRTKTSIDFLAVAPSSATYKERCEDPFGLAGFFPPRPRSYEQEQSGWWRDESPEHDSEEPKEMTNEDGNVLGFQRALFSTREEQQAETIIGDEDKLGVLSILTGKWPNWEDEITEDHLHSPYTCDETCDDEAVRLAYERRRGMGHGQQLDNGGGKQVPERTNKLFYGAEEEEEASGSSGLVW